MDVYYPNKISVPLGADVSSAISDRLIVIIMIMCISCAHQRPQRLYDTY